MRPRFSAASSDLAMHATAAKPLDASGGGVSAARGNVTPTRNAIGLSLPVAFAAKVANGSL